jgi:hypothetical protein
VTSNFLTLNLLITGKFCMKFRIKLNVQLHGEIISSGM